MRAAYPHFRISFWNHSSSGAQPQKHFPSPPRSHGLVISYWRLGSFSKCRLCINTCSRRRNYRWLICFPHFCDLQQQHVPAGNLFLLLLILPVMLWAVANSRCATRLNITRQYNLIVVSYLFSINCWYRCKRYHDHWLCLTVCKDRCFSDIIPTFEVKSVLFAEEIVSLPQKEWKWRKTRDGIYAIKRWWILLKPIIAILLSIG